MAKQLVSKELIKKLKDIAQSDKLPDDINSDEISAIVPINEQAALSLVMDPQKMIEVKKLWFKIASADNSGSIRSRLK